MKQSVYLVALLFVFSCLLCFGAGTTPIENGKLINDLDANGQNITALAADPYDAGWNGDQGAATKDAVYDEVEALVPTFPCIRLDMRRDAGTWTRAHDWEIKASTNNFTNLVYYVLSWAANTEPVVAGGGTADDPLYKCYFNDPAVGDVRVAIDWELATVHSSIDAQMADASKRTDVMYLWPSKGCDAYSADWFSPTNTNLRWSYQIYDGASGEEAGYPIWNMVEPTWHKAQR